MERPIRKRTYQNFMRAVKIVMEKGWDEKTAGEIVRRQFEEMECQQAMYRNTMPLQWYLDKVAMAGE